MANVVVYGKTAAGRDQALLVSEDGTQQSSATLSGGGDASAANQVSANTKLDTLAADIGAPADVAATADTGTFSLIAITKRIVAKLTSILAKQPALGTAGTPSTDVITVQGASSGTALPTTRSIPTVAGMTRVAINAAASGDNTLVSGTASQTIRVHKLFLVVTSAVNIKFKDGTAGTDFHPALPFQAGGGMTLDFDGEPWFITTTALNLVLNLSAAVQVSGYLYYTKS